MHGIITLPPIETDKLSSREMQPGPSRSPPPRGAGHRL
jgi:hypothetical protein